MKALLTTVMVAGVLFGGVFVDSADAGDKRRHKRNDARHHRGYDDDDYRRYGGKRYFRERDIVVVRDYYRPYYRPVPRSIRARYHRGGYLPVGWKTRVVPVPVYLEPRFVSVPHGYHRGFIDGHVVVHNSSGFILDIAAVF